MLDTAKLKAARSPEDLNRIVKTNFADDHQRLLTALSRHLNTLLGTNLRAAARFLREIAPVYAQMPARYQPHLIALEARLAYHRSEYHTALAKYREADRRYRRERNYLASARLGQELTEVYMYLGDYQRAVTVGKRSLGYFRRHDMPVATAGVLVNLGNVYHRLDKNRIALDYYNKARAIFEPIGGPGLATVEYNRANIHANLNELDQAATLYHRAAEIYRESGLEVLNRKAQYSIAYLHFLADRFTEALREFENVYVAFERLGDTRALAVTRLDLVELNVHLNQFGTAITHGQEVIEEFRRLGTRYEQAKANYFVALARLSLGDLHLAARSLNEAARLFRLEHNDLWLGMVLLARSKLHLQLNHPTPALRAAAEARRLFTRSSDRRRSNDADIVYLDALCHAGRPTQALALARRLLKRTLVSYQAYLVHTILGRIHYDRQHYETALASYRRAIDVVETMLAGLYPDEIRFFFVADKLVAYSGAVQCLLQLGRPEDSFLANLRALEMLNRRHLPSADVQARVPAALLKERERLRTALKRMGRLPESSHRGPDNTERLSETEQRLWSAEQRIRAHLYPKQRGHRAAQPIENVRALLRNDDLLVSFIAPPGGPLGAFRVSRQNIEFVPLDLDFERLRRHVWELYFILERAVISGREDLHTTEAAKFYLAGLHELLITPILAGHEQSRLIILTDGIFAQIPYGALVDSDGLPLRRRRDLRIIVNPDDLQRPAADEHRTFASHHNAVFALLSERLPAVELEARAIHDRFRRADLYLNEQADSRTFKDALGRCDGFIHIATHASRSSENPLFSKIVLADGPFFPFDLFAAGIKADLVALSGCQTAATGLYYGNSFSLAKAFYQAGARYVLATLWPVSDTVSQTFMAHFYTHLRKSSDVLISYRTALDLTANETNNPALWSAFVLLGI